MNTFSILIANTYLEVRTSSCLAIKAAAEEKHVVPSNFKYKENTNWLPKPKTLISLTEDETLIYF